MNESGFKALLEFVGLMLVIFIIIVAAVALYFL
jgi:hypothetical protein